MLSESKVWDILAGEISFTKNFLDRAHAHKLRETPVREVTVKKGDIVTLGGRGGEGGQQLHHWFGLRETPLTNHFI